MMPYRRGLLEWVLALSLLCALCPGAAFAADDATVPPQFGESYVATQTDGLPQISGISVEGGTVTVNGSAFGAGQGASSVRVSKGGVAGGTAVASNVRSWSDSSILVELDTIPTGVIDVTVTTEAGSNHKEKLVSSGDRLYEQSLQPPDDPFADDYDGVLPSSAILEAWGDYLYCLRQAPLSTGSEHLAFNSLERFSVETGKWETLESLPEWLTYASACVWEGNLLVAGVVCDTGSGSATTTECVYLYNFEQKQWRLLDSDNVPLGAGIVNFEGSLRLVGGASGAWAFDDGVYEYDTSSGFGDRVATLDRPVFCPQLVVHQDELIVYSYGETIGQYNGAGGARHLQVVSGSQAVSFDKALPSIADVDLAPGMPGRAEEFGSIVGVIDGLMLVGPAASEAATDTYIMDWNWEEASFVPYHKTASDGFVYGADGCIRDNMLYVIASSAIESAHTVFRATETISPSVLRGSSDFVWREGSDTPLTITFTPDFSRYYSGAIVDGVGLQRGSDFSAASGSTVINLLPGYLSTLGIGAHELVVYFDGYEGGPGAEVRASFRVEEASNGDAPLIPGGNPTSQPTSLARTGDLLLIAPFVMLGIGALVIGIYLACHRLRRR